MKKSEKSVDKILESWYAIKVIDGWPKLAEQD